MITKESFKEYLHLASVPWDRLSYDDRLILNTLTDLIEKQALLILHKKQEIEQRMIQERPEPGYYVSGIGEVDIEFRYQTKTSRHYTIIPSRWLWTTDWQEEVIKSCHKIIDNITKTSGQYTSLEEGRERELLKKLREKYKE